MAISTKDCQVQIQIWVDDNAVDGSTRGVYLVDNRVRDGSQNEGSANLQTACTKGSNICWQIFTINASATSTVQIQSIGNSNAWGAGGQPEQASDNPAAFTGQAQNIGAASYDLAITVAAGAGTTIHLNPAVNVSD